MRLILLSAAAVMMGCATAGSGTGTAGTNPNVISREEIVTSNISNAWDLISRQRPTWLRSRGSTTGAAQSGARVPNVYRNNELQGTADVLRNIATAEILELRYYTSAQVPPQYGSMNPAGIILITTR